MKRIGSPSNAEVLLWCHYSPEKHPRYNAPAVIKALSYFLDLGAIYPREDKVDVYNTTPLGAAWVRALCNTACPTTRFVDEFGQIIEED